MTQRLRPRKNLSMEKTIIDFSDPDEYEYWEVINDVVMGGISSSGISVADHRAAVFEGEVSLDNYGGFASMRTHPREFDLAGYRGFIIRARGDGKDYRLRLKVDEAYESIAYQAHFSTEAGRWILTRIPFELFTPVYRGQVIDNAPPLDSALIRRIGFMIADRQEGPFRLEIEWVKAYS